MVIKAFKVTGLALALDGSEDNLFRNQHLLQGTEAGAEGHDDDPEPEDDEPEDDEDPFASDSYSDSVTNCICAAVLIRTFPVISYSAKLDSLENN